MSIQEADAFGACDSNLNIHAEQRLEGKVAIITGGAAGIGEAIVRLFTEHGAKVIIADIADEVGEKACRISFPSPNLCALRCEQRRRGKSAAEYEMEEFDRVMKVNVRGVMLGIKHAARVMIPRKKGCIISTASTASVRGIFGPYCYKASKHAVIGLTKNGAAELGKYGIRVNAVSPYAVATALAIQYFKGGDACTSSISEEDTATAEALFNSNANLQGITLKAKDVAEAGLYLASDEAKYVSGHNLVVDGGMSCC